MSNTNNAYNEEVRRQVQEAVERVTVGWTVRVTYSTRWDRYNVVVRDDEATRDDEGNFINDNEVARVCRNISNCVGGFGVDFDVAVV